MPRFYFLLNRRVYIFTLSSAAGVCPTEWIFALTNIAQTPVESFHWKQTWFQRPPAASRVVSEATSRFLIVTVIVSLGRASTCHDITVSFLFPRKQVCRRKCNSWFTVREHTDGIVRWKLCNRTGSYVRLNVYRARSITIYHIAQAAGKARRSGYSRSALPRRVNQRPKYHFILFLVSLGVRRSLELHVDF